MHRTGIFALSLLMLSSARAEAPMGYLQTFGPAADPVTRLNWGLMAISIAVVVIISALVLYAVLRKRPPLVTDAQGRLPVGPDRGGMRWIYIGVGISVVVLFASVVWTMLALSAVAAPPGKPGTTVEVIAHQWWWEVRYSGTDTAITANEIHIPVGEPVRLKLVGDDVVHSFWVPKLGGKMDMIPGQVNYSWLQADRAGTYRGQCAEFCGAQHAHMALHVVAQDRAEFDAWRQRQANAASPPHSPMLAHGQQLFMDNCARCHTVRGTGADGKKAPDLTHLMGRGAIAAGTLPNNTGSLSGWVADAPMVKPGTSMPDFNFSPQDLRAVVAYLETLQ